MFTRKNKALALMIYLIFFIFLLTLLGENGILIRAELRRNALELERASEKKAADILLLREEKASSDAEIEDGDLLYSFDSVMESDTQDESIAEYSEFEGMSAHKAALISLLPPVLYLLIVFCVGRRRAK